MANAGGIGGISGMRDVVVRIRGQAQGVKQAMQETQESVARVRVAMGGFNAAGVGAVRIYKSLGTTFATLGGIVAVSLLIRQMQQLVAQGVQFNAQLEQMTLGLKAVLAANFDVVDSFGQQVEGARKLAAVTPLVAEQIDKIKTDALLTTNTLSELTLLFQQVVAFAAPLGATLDESRVLTVSIAQSTAALGLDFRQAEQGVRSLLLGMNITQNQLALALGITREMVNQWKNQGILVQEITKRLEPFRAAGKEAGDTFVGIVSTLRDFKEQLLGAAVAGAQAGLQQLFIDIRDSLGEVQAGVFVFRQDIQDTVEVMRTGMRGAFEVTLALVGALTDVAGLFARIVGILRSIDPTGGPLIILSTLLFTMRGTLIGMATAAAAFVQSLIASQAIQSLGLLQRATFALQAALLNAGAAAGFLNAALTFMSKHPIIAVLGVLITAFTAYRLIVRDTTDELEKQIKAHNDLANTLKEQIGATKQLQDSLKADLKLLEDETTSQEQRFAIVNRLTKLFPELAAALAQENVDTAEAVRLIRARIKAEEDLEATLRKGRAQSLDQALETAEKRLALAQERLQRAVALKPGQEVFLDPLSGLATTITTSAEEVTQAVADTTQGVTAARAKVAEIQRQIEQQQAPELRGRKKETEEAKKLRLKKEGEDRKTLASALLKIQEGQLADLENQRQLFEKEEGVSLERRLEREEHFLVEKQRIERAKLQISLDALRREEAVLKERAESEQEAQVQLLAVRRQIREKSFDLDALERRQETDRALFAKEILDKRRADEAEFFQFKKALGETSLQEEIDRLHRIAAEAEDGSKRQRDALQAVRDKERQLQAEREREALGLLGELQKRLEKGPLEIPTQVVGAGGAVIQGTRAITAGEELSPTQQAEAFRALLQEREEQVRQFQLGGGGTIPQFIEAIRSKQFLRQFAETVGLVGGPEEILGGALGGGGLEPAGASIQAQVAGFEQLPPKAQKSFNDVETLFKESNQRMIQEAKTFTNVFSETLFEGMYKFLVDRVDNELRRQ